MRTVGLCVLGLMLFAAPACEVPDDSPPHRASTAPRWTVKGETSPMDGSRSITLSLDSDSALNTVTLGPTLVVRCDAHKTYVYVKTDVPASQEFSDELFQHTVRLKFDAGKPITQTWAESQDMSALFAPNPTALARRLAQTKSFNFEFTSFRQGRLVLHFNVDGFEKELPLVQSACGWK